MFEGETDMKKSFISAIKLCFIFIPWFAAKADGGLIQLGRVVRYLNGDVKLLNLARYGNYCGVGGDGFPIDAVDRCCKQHDACYGQVVHQLCGGISGLLVPYHWTTEANSTRAITCERNILECSKRVCECDRDLSVCFRKMADSYHEGNVRGDRGLLGIFLTLIPESARGVKGAISSLHSLWSSSRPESPERSTPTEEEP